MQALATLGVLDTNGADQEHAVLLRSIRKFGCNTAGSENLRIDIEKKDGER